MKLLAIETATEGCSVALWIDGEVREIFEIAPRRHTELVLPWADALLAEAGVAKSQLDAIAVGRGPGAFTGVRLAIALAQGIALALDRPIVPVSTLAAMAAGLPPLRMQGRVGEGLLEQKVLASTGRAPPPNLPALPGVLRSTDCHRQSVHAPHHPLHSQGEQTILAAIDARMGEIYLGAYARDPDGLVVAIEAERLVKPSDATPDARAWIGVGTGFAADDGALVRALGASLVHFDATALPHAVDIARLAARGFAKGEAIAPERAEPAYLRDKVALTLAEQIAARK